MDGGRQFKWGVSTSSYQIEGAVAEDGRGDSIWDVFCRRPSAITDGSSGAVACDHYHRYPEDIDLMRGLGVDIYRFSVAWPRILPDGTGPVNDKGLDFYDRLTDAVLAAGIEPWLCFYHWDLPQPLQEKGGWANRSVSDWFCNYANIVDRRLGDRIRTYAIGNEASVTTVLGHGLGVFAPGIKDRAVAAASMHHQNLTQGVVTGLLRQTRPGHRIGTIVNLMPAVAFAPGDDEAALDFDAWWNRGFLDPLFLGRYPDRLVPFLEPFIQPDDLKIIHRPLDYLGLNYYSRAFVARDPSSALGFRLAEPPQGTEVTEMGWEVGPEYFRDQLLELKTRYGNPAVYVTENGAAYADPVPLPDTGQIADPDRVAFFDRYLTALTEAQSAGCDIRGYFAWSLLDNFEWAHGYTKRFGLVYVDYDTQRRIPKDSYHFLAARIVKANEFKKTLGNDLCSR